MAYKKLMNNYIYEFNHNNKPAIYIGNNEIIDVYTIDCYSNQIYEGCYLDDVDWSKINPATGPIYVENSSIGDVIKVDVLDIKVNNSGLIHAGSLTGALREKNNNKYYFLSIENNKVLFKDIEIDINPMIGVIGTSSIKQNVKTAHTYECGGNMDANVITKGASIYLPVEVEGGLLALGDLHAVMGDGEISGTGIEIGGIVRIKVSIIKNFKLNYPLIETKDAYFVSTFGKNSNEAIIKGYHELQRLIMDAYKLDYTDACIYMSMQAIINANQACLTVDNYDNPNNGPTFRVGIKKISNKKLINF